jgi:exosortase
MQPAKHHQGQRKTKKRHAFSEDTKQVEVGDASAKSQETASPAKAEYSWPFALAIAVIGLSTWFLYGNTFRELEYQWRTEADYSHGYLVPLLSLWLLYSRREVFPGFARQLSWSGVGLLVLAITLRTLGRLFYMEFLEGWSVVPWLAGCLCLLAGRSVLWWALPALLFLLFMVPLPYQLETVLSWKLQSLVTMLSSAFLRVLGFPAVAEGHTIWMGQSQMLVEEACSGLRIFVGMAAFAFFWATLIQRAWIDKAVIIAAVIPLAIVANTVRSIVICISYYWLDGRLADEVHDWAGLFMILLAAGLIWLVKEYWERVYRPVWVSIPANRLKTHSDEVLVGNR